MNRVFGQIVKMAKSLTIDSENKLASHVQTSSNVTAAAADRTGSGAAVAATAARMTGRVGVDEGDGAPTTPAAWKSTTADPLPWAHKMLPPEMMGRGAGDDELPAVPEVRRAMLVEVEVTVVSRRS